MKREAIGANKLRKGANQEQDSALVSMQQSVDANAKLIEKIESAIKEHESVRGNALASIPSDAAQKKERQDLLASVALGISDSQEVAELEARSRQQAVEDSAVIGEKTSLAELASDTVDGLKRALAEAKEQADQLEIAHQKMLREFFVAEAQNECKRYIDACAELMDAWWNILAIENLLVRNCPGRESEVREGVFRGVSTFQLMIPSWRIQAAQEVEHKNLHSCLFSGQNIPLDGIMRSAEAIKSAFADRGIRIS